MFDSIIVIKDIKMKLIRTLIALHYWLMVVVESRILLLHSRPANSVWLVLEWLMVRQVVEQLVEN